MEDRDELLEDFEMVVRNKVLWEQMVARQRAKLIAQGITEQTLSATEQRIANQTTLPDDRWAFRNITAIQ
ncbi:hypothetical protein BGM19_26870 [Streptomyces agglomeratus]|uniref:hypothetical protein n=1 Tax=Streptomyces agglomeratus TaxID=285458 RepID=UPI0008688241|nr:hypothetical protein [Streptomyces agglomeratus]OEJ61099.1 hypothetical protein BGM19_26870 [Streptomyces agglomeratus]